MNTTPSNVTVVSNVYPTHQVCDDAAFRPRLRGRSALKRLARLKLYGLNDERHEKAILLERNLVDKAQLEAYWDDGRAVDCPPGERPWGLGKDGIECRCQKTNCPGRSACFP